jgi:hypothetical protein
MRRGRTIRCDGIIAMSGVPRLEIVGANMLTDFRFQVTVLMALNSVAAGTCPHVQTNAPSGRTHKAAKRTEFLSSV